MVDTRRTASIKSKAKLAASTKQKTLLDLFPAKSTPATPAPAEQVPQDEVTRPTPAPTNTEDTAETSIAPVLEKLRQTSLEPQPLAPPPPAESLLKQEIIKGDETPSRPVSTCFDSITLVEESGSQENPIVVEPKPLKPSRSYKPSAAKPLAPLFAPRRTKTAPVSSPSHSPEIVLLELPDEATKKVAPIFVSRPKATPSSNPRSKVKDVAAPFPTKETQHVRGPQHAFTASSIPYDRLVKHASSSTLASYKAGSLKQLLDVEPPCQISTTSITYNKDTYLDTIPDEHREHPAISRLTTATQPEGSAHRLWVDKWRPTRAAEVLGNEDNATYLRDWIRALELQYEESPVKGKGKAKAESSRGTKRPRVVRKVEKKRGKKKRRFNSEDEDDSWIVYDTEYFSSPAPSSPVSRSSPPLDVEHDRSVPHTFTSLTNTILLAGPIGSGKTAAVYACAEELGWDVLEVYPGIGRRNGAGIDSLIGDAGKNHHVRQARTDIPSDICGKHFLKRGTPNGDEGLEVGLGPPSVRQSLILLEEVDILFKDDTNFWPAVTNFIKDCKRPVICTCNDITLVPTQDLPLQAILSFQACAAELAASYLQALCFQEDQCLLSRDALLGLYEDSAAKVGDIDLPDIPNPATSGDFPSADLRRAINGLQFGASGNSGWEAEETSADQGAAELVSYVDTYLRRGPWDTQEGVAWGSCEASQDDETGHTVLFWPRAAAIAGREPAAEWLSRGVGSAWIRPRELFRARVEHQSATGEAFGGTVPLPVLATRRREVGLDYGSQIREMVAAEDAWERVHGRGRAGRATRNSGGTFERSVAMSAEGRAALGRTVLAALGVVWS